MNALERQLQKLDLFQQKHPALAFPIAVIKKFGDDDAGYQAALITYYGFLSLFPLLLVATSVVGILSLGNSTIEQEIMQSVQSYFPVIGEQLSRNIQASTESGIALVVGLVLAFYGARGGADAFRKAMYHIWDIPKKKRTGFPLNIIKSMAMTSVGGLGLLAAALLSASASGLGRLFVFKVLSLGVGFLFLVPTFFFLYSTSLPEHRATRRDVLFNAVISSVGVIILQALGGWLIANQLKTLSPLYGTFALVLGLLFWIYVQALVVLYTSEVTIVRKHNYWPRSFSGQAITKADILLNPELKNKEKNA